MNRLDSELIRQAHAAQCIDIVEARGFKFARTSNERIGPCPVCGGTDRFGINLRKNVWLCRQCGKNGDAIALVQHLDGVSFREAVEIITGHRPEPVRDRPEPQPAASGTKPRQKPDNDTSSYAARIWRESGDPRTTPTALYLRFRGLELTDDLLPCLRFHRRCLIRHEWTAAMVALVRNVRTDEPQGVQCTCLDAEGHKREINGECRYSFGHIAGGAIKITPDEDVTLALGLAEGLETALSMRQLPEFGMTPVWAVVTAQNLRTFPVLPGIEGLFVGIDNDKSQTGDKKSAELVRRYLDAGIDVTTLRSTAIGTDLNDVIREAAPE